MHPEAQGPVLAVFATFAMLTLPLFGACSPAVQPEATGGSPSGTTGCDDGQTLYTAPDGSLHCIDACGQDDAACLGDGDCCSNVCSAIDGFCGCMDLGNACARPEDCCEGACAEGVCVAADSGGGGGGTGGASSDGGAGGNTPSGSCSDSIKNGDEGDVDCGGTGPTCLPCVNGKTCNIPSDCYSGSCVENVCSAA